MSRKPKFGDRIRGIYASEQNPERDGFYVETIRCTGRLNNGTHYRCTDGHGHFWEYPVDSTELLAPEPAGKDVEALVALRDGDWPKLIALAQRWGCLPTKHGANDPKEYEWAGDHEQDARHTYPMRALLICAVMNHLVALRSRPVEPEPVAESAQNMLSHPEEREKSVKRLRSLAEAVRGAAKRLPDTPVSAEVVACAGIMGMANWLERVASMLASPVAPSEWAPNQGTSTGSEPTGEDVEARDLIAAEVQVVVSQDRAYEIADHILAALRTRSPEPEPVAWRLENLSENQGWIVSGFAHNRERVDDYTRGFVNARAIPLYASPVLAPTGETAGGDHEND